MWIVLAVLSALFAGATSVLAKCGVKKTDPDVATFLRTIVVLLFSWLMAFIAGSAGEVFRIEPLSLLFLTLSGMATGASWICYFKALSLGDVNRVVPVDKSSTVLSIVFAIVLFGETEHLAVKIAGTLMIAAGTYMMLGLRIKRSGDKSSKTGMKWLPYAVLSAVFAALTSVLAKLGVTGVESNLATAVRTVIVLVMSFAVLRIKGKTKLVTMAPKSELRFIALSGVATGASWLCYYRAIQDGIVSVVVPIDKLSILVTVAFSCIFLKEKLSRQAAQGLLVIAVGTLAMTIFA